MINFLSRILTAWTVFRVYSRSSLKNNNNNLFIYWAQGHLNFHYTFISYTSADDCSLRTTITVWAHNTHFHLRRLKYQNLSRTGSLGTNSFTIVSEIMYDSITLCALLFLSTGILVPVKYRLWWFYVSFLESYIDINWLNLCSCFYKKFGPRHEQSAFPWFCFDSSFPESLFMNFSVFLDRCSDGWWYLFMSVTWHKFTVLLQTQLQKAKLCFISDSTHLKEWLFCTQTTFISVSAICLEGVLLQCEYFMGMCNKDTKSYNYLCDISSSTLNLV